jgi:hypothetical protein
MCLCMQMDKSCILLGDACETCERIFANPVPLVYTRHTARFLSLWLLLLPLGLWDGFSASWNHCALLPAATLISIFLFGIEELAVQLEEPFSILPLESLCAEVGGAADAMVDGRASALAPIRKPVPTRASAASRAGQPPRMHAASTSRRARGAAMLLPPLIPELAPPPTSLLTLATLSAVEQRERYFLAGGLCASISHALATPIDVVKTRKQTVAEYRNLSLLAGLQRVVQTDGAAALLTGLVPTVVGYGLEGACKFGAYEALKPTTAEALASLGLSAEQSVSAGPIVAAVIAGGLASLVLAPAEATRIRMVSESSYAELGVLGAAARIYKVEGAAGLLRGVPATCSKQLPYTATKQVTFDALVDAAASGTPLLPRWASIAGAAATAALLSTITSQPGDAILSEISRGRGGSGEPPEGPGSGSESESESFVAAVQQLGAAGLVRGLRARLVQVGIIVTVQLVLYDTLKHAFGVP